MRILNIISSPRGSKSASIAIADAFLAAYCPENPPVDVDTLNVWTEDLPDFDGNAIEAKYKGVSGATMDEAEAEIWARIQALVQRFRVADLLIFGVPMWNFAYPYKLKQLIDLVSQRDMLFTFDGRIFGPMLTDSRALVILTRGQIYDEDGPTPASSFDHQSQYLTFWLNFIGVTDVQTMVIEHTWDDRGPERLASGRARAAALARTF
ncbi:MAG: NAD(P)H-dependent oxidoreductase [Aquihabitans sp.]